MEDSDDEYSDPGSPLEDGSSPEMVAEPPNFANLFTRTTPQVMRQGTRLSCEVKSFESIYDAKGNRRILQAGSSTTFDTERYSHSFRSALIVTRFWKSDRSPNYTELEIRSPHMKAALKAVVPAYQDHDISVRHIVLRDQPRCLFHFRTELQAYGSHLQDQEAARHVFYLLQYLLSALAAEMFTFSAFVEDDIFPPSLDFVNLWMAFRPGDPIYMPDDSQRFSSQGCICRFVEMERCKCDVPFCPHSKRTLKLEGITTDGTVFGYYSKSIRIDPYDGFRLLQDLPAFPLQYHPEQQDIRQRLAVRGSKFVQLHGHHYRQYSGLASLVGSSAFGGMAFDHETDVTVKGRIIVDVGAFSAAQPKSSTQLSRSKRRFDPRKVEDYMTKDEYLICTDKITGYSLDEKRWGFFNVDLIQPVDFNDDAFDQLVIDPQSKSLISSLVRVHENESLHFDDFIKGKGRGMVFLLHGEPGVGKTLAAESIADLCRKPLLRVDSGTFGNTAEGVESSLLTAFKHAEKWQAVALLDEADVFLERRQNNHLVRNNLVSVFLRILEYYQGILFLTTNRISVLDKAVKSRIHLAINFPALSYETRLSLWDTFMSKASEESAQKLRADGSLNQLAQERLNGRQIKNIVRTAFALALGHDTTVRLEHVKMALDAMTKFEESFNASNGIDFGREDEAGEEEDQWREGGVKRRRLGS